MTAAIYASGLLTGYAVGFGAMYVLGFGHRAGASSRAAAYLAGAARDRTETEQ